MDFIIYGLGRWLHIGAGVLWIGLLWYFNFVQVPALKAAGADGTGAGITKHVAPRALELFRWSALATWLLGAMILGAKLPAALLFMDHAYVPIGIGAWLGTIMFLNVWGLIWPNQKKILNLYQYATSPASDEEKNKARRIAFLASRTNTMLSIPMLFFMVASGGIFRRAFFG
ncbi:MAG: urate hydroxylase PuuD [Betaproteobacteria bacterium]